MDGVHSIDGSQRHARRVRSRGRIRRFAVSVLVAVAVAAGVGGSLGIGIGVTALPARAATMNRAAVVVEVDGVIHTAKITFSTGSISGLDALRNAGFDPTVRVFGGNGGAVCALAVGGATIGCPADGTCLTCAAPDYWAYFRALAGATRYTYSVAGAGNTQVHDGDVEAWSWGRGSAPSPFVSFHDVWGPDVTTTTRPPATTPTTRPPSPPTSPTTVSGLGPRTPILSTSVPPSTSGTATKAKSPTTAPRTKSSTTGPITTNELRAGGSRKIATAPVVARGGGGSPYGLVGFALILAALLAAIVFARRRRSTGPGLPT
jgi:hypothetical protein